jgi:hypothetical protein
MSGPLIGTQVERMGYLYVATNEAMPGLVKVGFTDTSLSQRMSELHSTGVPTPFTTELVIKVDDAPLAEKLIHRALTDFRVASNREFFKCHANVAIEAVVKNIEDYEVDWSHTPIQAARIKQFESKYAKYKEDRRTEREAEDDRVKNIQNRYRDPLRTRLGTVVTQVRELEAGIAAIGGKPQNEPSFSPWEALFNPVPIGWMIYLVGFICINSNPSVSIVCAMAVVMGYLLSADSRKRRKEFDTQWQKWHAINVKLEVLQQEASLLKSRINCPVPNSVMYGEESIL